MGAGTPATARLTEHGVSFTLHEYELEPLSGVDQHRGDPDRVHRRHHFGSTTGTEMDLRIDDIHPLALLVAVHLLPTWWKAWVRQPAENALELT